MSTIFGQPPFRYHIHELLRHYGAEKLNGDPNHEREVRERHSTFFCGYLYEREADWFGPRQKDSAAEIREDIDNIQHAWHWTASLGNTNQLAQGLNSLCRFYLRESKLQDGQKACLSATDGLSRSLIEQPADLAQRLALWARTEAWKSEFVNEISQKEVLLVRSQQLLDRTDLDNFDTRADQAFVYLTTAFAIENRDLDEAIKIANRGFTLYRQLGNRWGEGKSAMVIGFCHFRQGDFDKADDRLRRSLDISRQLGDMANTIESSMKLGIVKRVQGSFEEAETLHTKSLRLAQQLQDRFLERMCLSPLPLTLAWAGNFLAAREVAERAKESRSGSCSTAKSMGSQCPNQS